MLIGYMRVSSDSDRQCTDLQRDALLKAGVDARNILRTAPREPGMIELDWARRWSMSIPAMCLSSGNWIALVDH